MIKSYGTDREDEIRGADRFWRDGGMMEICTNCSRFERKSNYDSFSMSDYQSCENCRHLGPEDTCLVHSQIYRRY